MSSVAVYAEDGVLKHYMPNIHATLRPRYEYSVDDGDMRFQVRNARVGLEGELAPIISYRAEVDLCDRGSVKPLDVWGRLTIVPQFKAQFGNMRMPFTLGSARAPHQYLFADRPTTDKQTCSPRNVGLKLIYGPTSTPLSIEGGVFNTTANSNHQIWQKRMAAAAKINYNIDNLLLQTGFQSIAPGPVRINHLSGALSWHTDSWLVEGEYVYKHYAADMAPDAHAYNFMADYGMPVKAGYFNLLSLQGRWDGVTNHSDGATIAEDGRLVINTPAFNRITFGSTLSYICAGLRCDLRLNYEQYFYHSSVTQPDNDRNKLVAELVIRF